MQLPFGSYRHVSRRVAASRLVNVLAEQATERGPVALRRCPGARFWLTLSLYGALRGLGVVGDRLYAVAGGNFVRVEESGVVKTLGSIPGKGRVKMASNESQLVIVTGSGTGFVYSDATGQLVKITDTGFRPAALSVDLMGQYLLFVERDSGRWFRSDLANALSYDALNFATAESAPDKLVGLIVNHEEVLLAGKTSMELWFNDGSPNFSFRKADNGLVELGCAAASSLVSADNSVFWLANDLTFRVLSDLTPQRISQHGVEQALARYQTVADCTGFEYTIEGHLCVVFQFPTEGRTWVYDRTTNEWHERQSSTFTHWPVVDCVRIYGHLVVGHEDGRLGFLEPDETTDWGDMMRCEWTYPTVYNKGARITHHKLRLGIETGQGIPGETRLPQVMLYASDDGGTYFEHLGTESMGREGARGEPVYWNRLGQSSERVYKHVVTDAVKFSVTDCELEADMGVPQ